MVNSTDHAIQSRASTGVRPKPSGYSDPVVAAFVGNLRKERAPVRGVYCSLEGAYLIYTEVDSKSPSALDRVYRAEMATQRQFTPSEYYGSLVLVFGHGNRAQGGEEAREEFLSRGAFERVV